MKKNSLQVTNGTLQNEAAFGENGSFRLEVNELNTPKNSIRCEFQQTKTANNSEKVQLLCVELSCACTNTICRYFMFLRVYFFVICVGLKE